MEPLSGDVGSERFGFDHEPDALQIAHSAAGHPPAGSSAEASLRIANDQLKAQLAAAREEIDRERASLAEKQREVVEQWEKKISELEKLQAELASERAALRARQGGIATAEPTAQPAETETDTEAAASEICASEVCASETEEPEAEVADDVGDEAPSVQTAPAVESWREKALAALSEESVDEPAPAKAVQRAAPLPPSGDEPQEDESIQEYFAALLNRSRTGGSPSGFKSPEPTPRRRATEPAPERSTSHSQASAEAAATTEEPQPPVDRSVLSELTRRDRTDVTGQFAVRTAMRELANAQARAAIHTHSQKKLVKTLALRLGGAMICFVGGLVGMYYPFLTEHGLGGAATAAMVIAIYLLFMGAKDGQQVLIWIQSRDTGSTKNKTSPMQEIVEVPAEVETPAQADSTPQSS